jgi:hypothetical protein
MAKADAPDRLSLIAFHIGRPTVAWFATIGGAQGTQDASWWAAYHPSESHATATPRLYLKAP